MPIARSIIIGFVTAALIAGLIPMLMLGEWNGPINFAVPLTVVAIGALALTVFVARPKSWRQGLIASLGFAVPVAAICFLMPRFWRAHLSEHAGQLRFVAFFIVALSLVVMMIRSGASDDEGTAN